MARAPTPEYGDIPGVYTFQANHDVDNSEGFYRWNISIEHRARLEGGHGDRLQDDTHPSCQGTCGKRHSSGQS